MSRNRRFQFGKPYQLTDLKDGVFIDEPAIFVGKKDSDKERPTLCAVCGQPLGAEGYHSFFLMGLNGHGKDMMIGNGCIKDRIREKEIDIQGDSFMDTWNRVIAEFPKSGRWYGTFLHHCIAKPYVRNKKAAEKWDESIMKLPGVRYITKMIDDLRDEGWTLDAEKTLGCGNVDLLARHPEKGIIVFDWKSDLSFDNHAEYVEQVSRYMSEIGSTETQKITGYIIWVRDERREFVPYRETIKPIKQDKSHSSTPSSSIRCTLNIEMNGGQGIRRKKIIGYSQHRPYGEEVSFYIPPFEPWKYDHDFEYFEASPYREGDRMQPFNSSDAESGFRVNFICSKKRHSFDLTAYWKKTRPIRCLLGVYQGSTEFNPNFIIESLSQMDAERNEYAEFEVSEINNRLGTSAIAHATLIDDGTFVGTETEWLPEDLQEGMKIRFPCSDDHFAYRIKIETTPKPRKIKDSIKKIKADPQPSFLPKVQESPVEDVSPFLDDYLDLMMIEKGTY